MLEQVVGAVVVLLVLGCGKSDVSAPEPSASTEGAPARAESAATAELNAMETSVQDLAVDAAQALASFQLPDLSASSSAQLAAASTRTLDQIAVLSRAQNPEVGSLVSSVKSSLNADKALQALAKLPQLAETVKSIPGGQEAMTSAQQMISAWALKQNFEPAMITPALRALQTGDYALLASQASQWIGTGELSDQQQQIIRGVLTNYGLDLPAGELLNKVKGFL
ncbi:MAG: hypothetical protein SynsKO_21710 [Synoicihabitans sp.]